MQTEIEAKFLDIKPDEIRKKLKKVGAKLEYPERLMRRMVYEHPNRKETDWFRVRDEGDKITLSYKKLFNRSLNGTKEITITINDFNEGCKILDAAHLTNVAYQETRREKWILGESEITIDTWPWIPTFIEIESSDEKELRKISDNLVFNWKDALHGSVETAYMKYYDVTEEEVADWPKITFIPVPEWLEEKRKKRSD